MRSHAECEPATSESARTLHPAPDSLGQSSEAEALAGLRVHRALGNQAVQRLLDPRGAAAPDPPEIVPQGRAAGVMVQRSPAADAGSPPPAAPPSGAPAPVAAGSETPAALLVEDGTADLAPGQMRKGELLSQLRAVVCPTAEAALQGTAWSSIGCPWIDHWFAYYGQRSASQVEASLRRFSGVTVAAAADYVPLVAGRVRSAIDQWAAGDEVTAVPPAVADGVVPAGEEGEEPAVCEAPRSPGVLSSVLSSVGGLLMKRSANAAPASTADPEAVLGRLGSGRSLDAGVKRRMEGAFGSSFSQVRLHADAPGQRVAGELGARAFAVGDHVAFASGEYRPGTPVGDALIAHELAHVIQQDGGSGGPATKASGAQETGALEMEADRSAVGAVMALWGGIRGKAGEISRSAAPRLRSSLQLQGCFLTGCKTEEKKAEKPAEQAPPEKPPTPPEKPVEPRETPPAEERCDEEAKIIKTHKISPTEIKKPGDSVTISFEFTRKVRAGVWRLVRKKDDDSLRLKYIEEKNGNQLKGSETWTGTAYQDEHRGAVLQKDDTYRSKLADLTYGWDPKGAEKHACPNPHYSNDVEIKIRAQIDKDQLHFSADNKKNLAKLLATEANAGYSSEGSPAVGDTERKAVAWTVRNRMLQQNNTNLEAVVAAGGYKYGKSAEADDETLAEEVLKAPLSSDTIGGATHYVSPVNLKTEDDAKPAAGYALKSVNGLKKKRWFPGWADKLTAVPSAIDDRLYMFYK